MALLSSVGSYVLSKNGQNHYYVGAGQGAGFFMDFLTFIILYNNLIPIRFLFYAVQKSPLCTWLAD